MFGRSRLAVGVGAGLAIGFLALIVIVGTTIWLVERSNSLFDPPQVNAWMSHSKIYLPVREDITRVVVLFDKEGVKGKTLLQLADYAMMRGLARTRS